MTETRKEQVRRAARRADKALAQRQHAQTWSQYEVADERRELALAQWAQLLEASDGTD